MLVRSAKNCCLKVVEQFSDQDQEVIIKLNKTWSVL
jgi:hypothetical protein